VFNFQGEEFLTIRRLMEDEPADCTARAREFANQLERGSAGRWRQPTALNP
jgi:hypothetical protein